MACGEGYGSEILARGGAASVVGVDANPEAHEHARLRYTRAEPALRARPGADVRRAVRRRRVPADDRARRRTRARSWTTSATLTGDARHRLHLDAQRADAGARRAPSARATRGTSTSTAPTSSASCARRTSGSCGMLGLHHARKLRMHELAIRHARWDDVHARLRPHQALLRPLRPGDQRARLRAAPRPPRPGAGLRGRLLGELSIVLHTHMPYVEGYGTWPFGEEWLWEAIVTSYLPVLDVLDAARRRRDAVADAGPVRPARGARRRRAPAARSSTTCARETHRLDIDSEPDPGVKRRAAPLGRRLRSRRRSAARRSAAAPGCWSASAPTPRWTSSATHAILPLLATDAGVRLQLEAGSTPTARASATGTAASGCPSAPTPRGSITCSSRPASTRRAST